MNSALKGLTAIFLVGLIWASGLVAFADRVDRSTPAPEPERADGVVTLTGAGSNERIIAGVELLEAGKAKRMLVSGVNREASREDIRTVSKAVRKIYDCCVDLGFTAADTVGNARETAEWADSMRYSSLIVVTADYHMPRAMLELRSTLPHARLQAYPVSTSVINAHYWWRTGRGARLMITEYSKYLAILGREIVRGMGPKDAAASPPATVPSPKG